MQIVRNAKIVELLQELEYSTSEWIASGNAGYDEGAIQECLVYLQEFLLRVEDAHTKDALLEEVALTVGLLNQLNETAAYSLIETDERETIAEIIIYAGYLKGFNSLNEDITEDFREW